MTFEFPTGRPPPTKPGVAGNTWHFNKHQGWAQPATPYPPGQRVAGNTGHPSPHYIFHFPYARGKFEQCATDNSLSCMKWNQSAAVQKGYSHAWPILLPLIAGKLCHTEGNDAHLPIHTCQGQQPRHAKRSSYHAHT